MSIKRVAHDLSSLLAQLLQVDPLATLAVSGRASTKSMVKALTKASHTVGEQKS